MFLLKRKNDNFAAQNHLDEKLMEETLYLWLMRVMPVVAVFVFVTLFFIKAGYGMFRTPRWGLSLPNKVGWVLMELPAVVVMLWLWWSSDVKYEAAPLVCFLLFEAHYVQRTFIFPLLMRGKSRMPVTVMLMGIIFNVINGFLIGEDLFHIGAPADMSSPAFIIGTLVFFTGMAINLHSDNVIRHLRPKGDTRHYLPQRGMYRYVTSGNYFGELTEWVGFAILTGSAAAWVFALWTFANLAPRAYAIRNHYRKEFGTEAVGRRKCLIPFVF